MTCEAKILAAAKESADLAPIFFTSGQVRWFDRHLQPNYLKIGATCMRYRRVSTVRLESHPIEGQQGTLDLQQILFQFDVLDMNAETARSAAQTVADWLKTVSFRADPGASNFVIGERADMEFLTEPPAYVETLTVRIFYSEN